MAVVTLNTIADTWLNSNTEQQTTNYDSDTSLTIGYVPSGGTAGIKHPLMGFTLPTFESGDPQSVTLRLNILTSTVDSFVYAFGLIADGSNITSTQATWLQPSDGNNWEENGASADSAYSTSGALGPTSSQVGTWDFDLSELTIGLSEKSGQTVWIVGYATVESGATRLMTIASKETATPPQLLLTVTTAPATDPPTNNDSTGDSMNQTISVNSAYEAYADIDDTLLPNRIGNLNADSVWDTRYSLADSDSWHEYRMDATDLASDSFHWSDNHSVMVL